jgi:hypothetical protein
VGQVTALPAQLHSERQALTTIGPDQHMGPAFLYPSPDLTQGKADTLSVADLAARYRDHCRPGKATCTYSEAHRNVPASEHTKVYEEYAVPLDKRNKRAGEVDHFYPLCAGGSNDITNLWYQPTDSTWNGQVLGFHQKDDLETWVCAQIKAGRLDPQVAFNRITSDWVAYYLEVKPPHQMSGK